MTMRFKSNPDPHVLTPRQKRVLDVITETVARTGVSPTMEELAAKLKVSKVTVFEHVTVLRRKGRLSHSHHYARAMRPLDTPAVRLAKLVKMRYGADVDAVALAESVWQHE